MSLYIIKHDAPAVKYLAPTGAKRAYTDKLQCARTFHTKEHAERARCPGNERVVAVVDELRSPEEYR